MYKDFSSILDQTSPDYTVLSRLLDVVDWNKYDTGLTLKFQKALLGVLEGNLSQIADLTASMVSEDVSLEDLDSRLIAVLGLCKNKEGCFGLMAEGLRSCLTDSIGNMTARTQYELSRLIDDFDVLNGDYPLGIPPENTQVERGDKSCDQELFNNEELWVLA